MVSWKISSVHKYSISTRVDDQLMDHLVQICINYDIISLIRAIDESDSD